ncbi:thymidine kinase [Schaalia suimastitidis]|uniref:thymidine kinase n=1 Tax=Schaalia suimastitidis TaxID=121163 RepID=UPI0003F65377|nr:thymidine kinase [Schaalia suimastitidis]
MAKLYFRYGAMNSGKSTALLQAAHNYEERGQRVLLLKPFIDTKGGGQIVSRLGVSREVDLLVDSDADLMALISEAVAGPGESVACILIDEAQFLTEAQVDDLMTVAVELNIPVIAYGIRTDFRTVSFPGARRLLEVAHSLEELKTICRCGRKAMFNGRKVNDAYVFDGEQVAIDGVAVTYESLCPSCYLNAGGRLPFRSARPAPSAEGTRLRNEALPEFAESV